VATHCWTSASKAPAQSGVGAQIRLPPLGWQPSRFLNDRVEAERAFALAEQLGSVNAAATQLDTTWPSLRKAFTRRGLGMPTPNPEAVGQRTVAAARHRSGQPVTPPLDPVFVALKPQCAPGAAALAGRASPVGPLRRGVRRLGRRMWWSS
jgi:hypothetical protein